MSTVSDNFRTAVKAAKATLTKNVMMEIVEREFADTQVPADTALAGATDHGRTSGLAGSELGSKANVKPGTEKEWPTGILAGEESVDLSGKKSTK